MRTRSLSRRAFLATASAAGAAAMKVGATVEETIASARANREFLERTIGRS